MHVKKQNNMTQDKDKNQCVETNPEMAQVINCK